MSNWEAIHSSQNDHWETPSHLFDALNRQFAFDLDAAAADNTAKCDYYFTREDDALSQSWAAPERFRVKPGAPLPDPSRWRTVWLNCPYGRNMGVWLEKAVEESRQGLTVVTLTMASTDTAWWHDHVMAHATEVRLLRGRVRFLLDGELKSACPKGSAISIFTPWGQRGRPNVLSWVLDH